MNGPESTASPRFRILASLTPPFRRLPIFPPPSSLLPSLHFHRLIVYIRAPRLLLSFPLSPRSIRLSLSSLGIDCLVDGFSLSRAHYSRLHCSSTSLPRGIGAREALSGEISSFVPVFEIEGFFRSTLPCSAALVQQPPLSVRRILFQVSFSL